MRCDTEVLFVHICHFIQFSLVNVVFITMYLLEGFLPLEVVAAVNIWGNHVVYMVISRRQPMIKNDHYLKYCCFCQAIIRQDIFVACMKKVWEATSLTKFIVPDMILESFFKYLRNKL